MIYRNTIYCLDNMNGMSQMEKDSVDLCISSPPYNLGNKKVKYETYDDNKDFYEYIDFLRIRYISLFDIMKPDGRVIINLGDQENGKKPMHFFIMEMMLTIGYHPYVTIIWDKQQTRSRTAWGSFMKASCPSFPHTHEYIMVFYKTNIKKENKGISTIEKQDFIDWSIPIWKFPPETNMKKKWDHEAVFPEELPRRCIQLFSYQDDLVLDIFSGVGTTCAVAKKLGRQYIGFEINQKDVTKSNERLRGID